MPFVSRDRLKPSGRGRGNQKDGVYMLAYTTGPTANSVYVVLSPDVCETLNVTEGDSIRLTLGCGADAGWVQVSSRIDDTDTVADGLFTLRQRQSGSKQLKVAVRQFSNGMKHRTERCEHRVPEVGVVEFKLPVWAVSAAHALNGFPKP